MLGLENPEVHAHRIREMVKLDLGVECVDDDAAANEVAHQMSVQKATHKTLANEVTSHEAAAQMTDAYVDDSSVLDQAVTEDDEGITDVDDSSAPDEDDRTEQTDVQNSYKKYVCSSKRRCYDDPFPLDYHDDPSSGSD